MFRGPGNFHGRILLRVEIIRFEVINAGNTLGNHLEAKTVLNHPLDRQRSVIFVHSPKGRGIQRHENVDIAAFRIQIVSLQLIGINVPHKIDFRDISDRNAPMFNRRTHFHSLNRLIYVSFEICLLLEDLSRAKQDNGGNQKHRGKDDKQAHLEVAGRV